MIDFIINITFALIIFTIWFWFWNRMKEEEIYLKALKIFYEWKNEVWGVAYRGVWNIYEEWIGKKINSLRNAKK